MLTALLLVALFSPTGSPAKAGAQDRAGRNWAPAFAGEVGEDGPSGQSTPGSLTPVDAERAFAADAQTLGQWTAFAKWSTDDAVMFVPQLTNVHDWLKDRKNPAKAVEWWPTASYISCDGSLAVNTGGWERPDGSVGYFTTLWQRQNGSDWKWTVDHGDVLKAPRSRQRPSMQKASCMKVPGTGMREGYPAGNGGVDSSPDGTLRFSFRVAVDGSRAVTASLWDGSRFRQIIDDKIAPK